MSAKRFPELTRTAKAKIAWRTFLETGVKNKMELPKAGLAAMLVFCAFQFSQAQSQSTRLPPISGPISSALGGAGVTSTEQSEAGFVNPASLALARATGLSFVHQYGFYTQEVEQTFTSATLVDPMTVPSWPSSFSAAQRIITFDGIDEDIEGLYFNVSTAKQLTQNFAMGLSVLHSSLEFETKKYAEWNSTVGFLYQPIQSLLVGLTYSHIVPPEDYPEAIKLSPELAVGAEYDVRRMLKIRAEVVRPEHLNDDKEWILKTGFQAPIGAFVLYRMGYRFDQQSGDGTMTLGLAFDGPQFKIDYSYQEHQVEDGKSMHGIDLRWPF